MTLNDKALRMNSAKARPKRPQDRRQQPPVDRPPWLAPLQMPCQIQGRQRAFDVQEVQRLLPLSIDTVYANAPL